MMRRAGALLASFLFLNLTGCGLVGLVMLPIKLLLSLFGAAGTAVGLADVNPANGPVPVVESMGSEQWLVTGLRPDAPCTILCTAPGCEPRRLAWPGDFAGHGENVAVRLERSR